MDRLPSMASINAVSLAGNVGIARQSDLHVKGEIGPQDVLAQKAEFVGLPDHGAGAVDGLIMAVANEDVAAVGIAGVSRDGDPFDNGGRDRFPGCPDR